MEKVGKTFYRNTQQIRDMWNLCFFSPLSKNDDHQHLIALIAKCLVARIYLCFHSKITRGQAYHVYVNSTSILRHFGLTKPRIAGGKALGDREREREIDLGLVDSG